MSTADLLHAIRDAVKQRSILAADAAVTQLDAAGPMTGVSATDAEEVVKALMSQRWFPLANRVGATSLASFGDHRGLRRRYAQSLIETGRLAEARAQFEGLLQTSKVPTERYECIGFIGRTWKQQFVNDERQNGHGDPPLLQKAIDAYYSGYQDNPAANTWHGINAVACAHLARRRGFANLIIPDVEATAHEIIDTLTVADLRTVWDEATWAESCVALNDWDGASAHLLKYLWHPDVSAFTLGSTLRQLEEIWGIRNTQDPGAPVATMVRARALELADGSFQMNPSDVKAMLAEKAGRYEKVFGADHFTTLKNYRTGLQRCAAVARIGVETDRGEGTGFVMRGADIDSRLTGLVLVTNAHVIDPNGVNGIRPENVKATFQANDSVGEEDVFKVTDVLFYSEREKLDITIARLDATPTIATPYPIAAHLPNNGARVIAVGHPGGGTLSFSLNDNELLDSENPPGWKVHYRTPTEGGSSGSPIFSRSWELIAVHHYGGDDVLRLNGQTGTYQANEGTSIQAIRAAVAAALV